MKKMFCVKITIGKSAARVDDVVYYRNKISLEMLAKWRWYFGYLSSLVKVSLPRSNVVLFLGEQDLLQGTEYVTEKTKTLLRYKESALKRLENNVVQDDLFGFASEANDEKKEGLRKDIEDLKNGNFKYYIPPEYINKIKLYTIEK